jgi:hypothetical protein
MASRETLAIAAAEAVELETRRQLIREQARLRARNYDTSVADELLNRWSAARAALLDAVGAWRVATNT